MSPHSFLLLIVIALTPFPLPAQASLSLPLDDPLYVILDVLAVRGLITTQSEVKPYTTQEVRERTLDASASLSPTERKIVDRFVGDGPVAPLEISFRERSELRGDLLDDSAFHSFNAAEVGVEGSLAAPLWYRLNMGMTLDRVNPDAFAPYTFTKQWDGFHFGLGGTKYSDGAIDQFSVSFTTSEEVSLSLLDRRLLFRWGRMRREWGGGERSIFLSGTARPFDGMEARATPLPWLHYSVLVGSLGDWTDKAQEQKMLSAHMLEIYPLSWLRVAVWESVVWGKRLELAYLNPLTSFYLAQNSSTGDMDNVALGFELTATIAPWLRGFFSFYADEIETDHLDRFFAFVKNQYAFSTGIQAPVPGLPFTLATLQYTKIEPYCYTHYLQSYPFFTGTTNISYSNDGENLGYPLPPNSDEVLIQLDSVPSPAITLRVGYRLVRHGTGRHEDGQIEGDIDIPLDYANVESYPLKRFLDDGVYEWINVATLRVGWSPAFFSALTLWAEYSFVHAVNYGNISGNTVSRHLLGSGLTLRF